MQPLFVLAASGCGRTDGSDLPGGAAAGCAEAVVAGSVGRCVALVRVLTLNRRAAAGAELDSRFESVAALCAKVHERQPPPFLGEAHFLVDLGSRGDRAFNVGPRMKVPEGQLLTCKW